MSDHHDDFGGLGRDLLSIRAVTGRRKAFRLAAGLGLSGFSLFGCSSSTAADDDPGSGLCSRIPEETAGPFPGEGSNGPNVLNQTGVVRQDIRSSFAGLSGTADGVPLTVVLNIVSATSCSPLAGAAVYSWHCDRPGRYSLYSAGVTN